MNISEWVVDVANYYTSLKAEGVRGRKAREITRKAFGLKGRGTVLWCEQAAKPAGRYVAGKRNGGRQ